MSHNKVLGEVKCKSTEPLALVAKEFGYKVVTNCTVKDHYGNGVHVDMAITNGRYYIGLRKNSRGTFDLVGDFQCFGWELTQKFKAALNGRTSDAAIANVFKAHLTKYVILLAARNKAKKQVNALQNDGSINMILDL